MILLRDAGPPPPRGASQGEFDFSANRIDPRDVLTHVHAHGTETEYEAVLRVAPHLGKMKQAILDALLMAGETGLTPDEYAEARGLLINTVRRRFTDLWKEGRIQKNGAKRENSNGNNAAVWVVV